MSLNCDLNKKKETDPVFLYSIIEALSHLTLPGPNALWTKLIGTTPSNLILPYSMSKDGSGNIYIAGQASGTLYGVPGPPGSMFIIQMNTDGNALFTKRFDRPIKAMTTDNAGNFYVIAITQQDIDGETYSGGFLDENAVLTKFSNDGTRQWTRLMGDIGIPTIPRNIVIDTFNNIYILGNTQDGLDGQTTGVPGGCDYLVKYDSNGNKQWTKLLGNSIGFTDLTTFNGNAFLIGGYNNYSTRRDIILIKYDSNGNKEWERTTGENGFFSHPKVITADQTGNLYITGTSSGSLNGQPAFPAGEIFTAKYNSNGNLHWVRTLGINGNLLVISGQSSTPKAITLSSQGVVFVSGETEGNIDNQPHTSDEKDNLFLVRYDLEGNKLSTSLAGTKGHYMSIVGIVTDASGFAYITGSTDGPLNGVSYIGTPGTGSNIFITKY